MLKEDYLRSGLGIPRCYSIDVENVTIGGDDRVWLEQVAIIFHNLLKILIEVRVDLDILVVGVVFPSWSLLQVIDVDLIDSIFKLMILFMTLLDNGVWLVWYILVHLTGIDAFLINDLGNMVFEIVDI